MTDDQTNSNYQDILDKYAQSLNSTGDSKIPQETIKPEPELEPKTPPESILTPEEEAILKAQSQPEPTPQIEPPPITEAIIPPSPQTELPPESSEIKPKKQNNFFKYLFFFSLIIFIIVLVLVVISFLNSQKPVTDNREIIENNSSPTPFPATFCEINDQQYSVGETFLADDNCNTCTCGEDLTVICTTNTCDLSPTQSVTSTPSAIPSTPSGTPTKSATISATKIPTVTLVPTTAAAP